MKTKDVLEHAIIDITMKIQNEFPELSKYLTEMPVDVSENDKAGVTIKSLEEYYNSLIEVLKDYTMTHQPSKTNNEEEITANLKSMEYKPEEDIYNQAKEEKDINPEDISRKKTPNEKEKGLNEKDFKNHISGDDLDIPGSEIDDQEEIVGSEDEENNFYSLGGDDHNDLDEDNA